MGHVGSKTRSLGQILEKHCVRCRGLTFCPILMKLGLNICLDEILKEFKNGSLWTKNYVARSNLGITLCTPYMPHFQSHMHETFQNICLDKILEEFENGSRWLEN